MAYSENARYATPNRSSFPGAFPSSDAPDVPISSSPGLVSSSPGYQESSQESLRSFYCAYSLSSRSDSCQRDGTPPPFVQELTQRLLTVAAQQSDITGSDYHEGECTAGSGLSTPRYPQNYRIVKRALTRDNSIETYKSRKIEHETVTQPCTPPHTRIWSTEVPSIAPPDFYVPRLPLSAETEAKIRLGKFLEREANERIRDGLLDELGYVDADRSHPASQVEESQHVSAIDWEKVTGIGTKTRIKVIDWLTSVLPKHASGRSAHFDNPNDSGKCSAASSFSSTSSTTSCELSNLYDQLVSCPKTRFHAIWMFMRYCWITASTTCGAKLLSSKTDQDSDPTIWDNALACLAISVKFNRDFLIPLYPVQSHEFLSLAPHEIYYGDLEAAQRDVLKAISYSVGVSPQAILDELWTALPSLRHLISFQGGWNALQKEVWFRLFDAIYASDVLQFPQSRLVAVALIDSLVPCLAARYEYEALWHIKAIRRARDQKSKREASARYLKQAVNDAEGTILDIQAVVGITDDQLAQTRAWWQKTVPANED